MKFNYTLISIALCSAALLSSCKEEPSVGFSSSATDVMAGEVVSFTDNSTDAYNHIWDFGDGEWSRALNPTHIYYDEGSYDVTLQVTDKKGSIVSVSAPQTINVSIDSVYALMETDEEVKNQIIVQMVGEWDFNSHTVNFSGTTVQELFYRTTLEFMANGSILVHSELGNKSQGNYSIINNEYLNINFTVENSDGQQFYVTGIYNIDKLSDDSMTLQQTNNLAGGTTNTITVRMER